VEASSASAHALDGTARTRRAKIVGVDPSQQIALERSGLLVDLEPSVVGELADAAEERRFADGEELFHQGDPARQMLVVVAGQVKLSQVSADGQEVIIRFATPGELVGGVAVLEGRAYPVSGTAIGNGRALTWSAATLDRLFHRHPNLALNTMRVIADRMRELQDRLRELATERVAQRVARTLLRLAAQLGRKVAGGVEIDLPLSRQSLAELCGTTQFTVSRLLSDWEARGLLEAGRERVRITQPHGLVAIAEDLPPGR